MPRYDSYESTKRIFRKANIRYTGRIISAIGVGLIGLVGTISLFYLNSMTNRLEQNLDIIPRVTDAIEEDGEISKPKLQDFLKDIGVNYRIRDGERLDLKTEYRSQIDIRIVSEEGKFKKIGETDRQAIKKYLTKHKE